MREVILFIVGSFVALVVVCVGVPLMAFGMLWLKRRNG